MERKPYPTDLTDEQWKLIAEFLPPIPHLTWPDRAMNKDNQHLVLLAFVA